MKQLIMSLPSQPKLFARVFTIDGHEREDVVKYGKLYQRKIEILSSTHLPPPPYEDGLTSFQTGNPSATKSLVLIFHDELSFHGKRRTTHNVG